MPKGKKAIFDFTKYKDVEADYLTVNEWCEDDECADDERLAGPRLARDDVEATRELLIQRGYQSQVAYVQ